MDDRNNRILRAFSNSLRKRELGHWYGLATKTHIIAQHFHLNLKYLESKEAATQYTKIQEFREQSRGQV